MHRFDPEWPLLRVLLVEEGGLGKLMHRLHHDLLVEHHETLKLAIPAGCYTLQNNLVFVALTNLSAAAAQVLYQTKTLSTALFSVIILKKTFPLRQWISFAMLAAGVVLVQSQDTKSYLVRVGGSPLLGGVAALGAAGLSGFAGVYLELMFTRTGSSLFMRNVQLALFSIPLQLYAIYQTDYAAVTNLGVRLGWTSLAPSFSMLSHASLIVIRCFKGLIAVHGLSCSFSLLARCSPR